MNMYEDLYMARCGDPQAFVYLTDACKPMICKMVSETCQCAGFFVSMKDDLVQEGMICLLDALSKYRPNQDATFKTFVRVLLDRKIKNILRNQRAQKVVPQECIVSLEKEYRNGRETLVMKLEQQDCFASPEFVLAYHEAEKVLCKTVETMKPKDKKSVEHWSRKMNYKSGALAMRCSEKTYSVRMRNVKKQIISAVYQS